jgi:hypothetical protein
VDDLGAFSCRTIAEDWVTRSRQTDLMSSGAPVIQSAPVFALPLRLIPGGGWGTMPLSPLFGVAPMLTGSFFMDQIRVDHVWVDHIRTH